MDIHTRAVHAGDRRKPTAAVAEVSADCIFMETLSNPLLRWSLGIEAAEDIVADLGQALGQ